MNKCSVLSNPAIGLKLKVLHVFRIIIATIGRFLFALYYGQEGKKIPPIKDDVLKQPAIEVARRIRNKEISSVEVVEACIRRIKDVNSAVNCLIEDRFEAALKEAKEADDLIKEGTKKTEELEKEKPFLGVPFTTKDSIAVKGLHNTAGVVLRKDVVAENDADVIRLLRAKGAIILGTTNIPELCMWWETHNHIYGRTSNPYNTTRIVGGSSGGEGCIQGLGGSIFGIGSDIGGSIRMPAFFNGIFGHKPSWKIVSNGGQYPPPITEHHNSFLGTGPMVRHAVDMKPILQILADENASKLSLDTPVDIRKLKVYYQISMNAPLIDSVERDIEKAFTKVIDMFETKHNIKAEEKSIALLQKSQPIWLANMKSKEPFGKLIMGKNGAGTICKEIVKNAFGLSGNTLIGLFTALNDLGGVEIGSERYKHYQKLREDLEKYFKDMLGENGVFLFPTHPTAAPYHNEPVIRPMNFAYTAIINCLGFPATTIPLGLNKEGLPIGLQVIANHNNDRLCLAVAEELDKDLGGWIEPQNSKV